MPPPSAAQQKVLIAQFVALTGQSERQATRVRIFRVHPPYFTYADHREPSWSLTRINLMTTYCSTRHGLGYGCIGLCFSGAYLARSCIIMIVRHGVANIHFNSTSRMPGSSSTKLSIRKLLPSFSILYACHDTRRLHLLAQCPLLHLNTDMSMLSSFRLLFAHCIHPVTVAWPTIARLICKV
jgi:hypothetical protein